MIWYDIKKLENGLKNKETTDKDVFKYLIITLVLFSIIPYTSNYEYNNIWFTVAEITIFLTITIAGTWKTFDINSKGDNSDYFKRYIALAFVTMVRLFIIALFLVTIVVTVEIALDNHSSNNENMKSLINLIMMTLFSIYYYYKLAKSFQRVSN